MLKLYGSTTSPYVRRLRIWLANTEHEFVNLQIFAEQDRELMVKRNPTLKIPMLEDDGEFLFDSRVIYRYLNDKFAYPSLSWEQENHLTLIDAVNDSLVQMFLLQRSEFDTNEDRMYFKLQRERVDATLYHLNELSQKGYFSEWNYPSICLYCLVDWVEFRHLHDLAEMPGLVAFRGDNKDRIEVTATDPRNS